MDKVIEQIGIMTWIDAKTTPELSAGAASEIIMKSKGVNHLGFYFPEKFMEFSMEDWGEYSEERFPYTEVDAENSKTWLRAGYYQEHNCNKCDTYYTPIECDLWAYTVLKPNAPTTHATSWEEVKEKAREEWMLKHAGEAVVKYDCNFNNFFVEYLSRHWPVSPTPMSETWENKEVEQNLELDKELTFDELIQHGRDNGANIVNGMPWSWKINGKSITHENDDVYLIETIGGITKRFERNNGQVLMAYSQGLRVHMRPEDAHCNN